MLIQLDIPDEEVARKVLGIYKSGRLTELTLTFHSRRVVGVTVKDVLMTPSSGGAMIPRFVPSATGVYIQGTLPQHT